MSGRTQPPRFVFLLNRAQRAVQRWIEGRPEAWEGASSAQAGLLFLLASRDAATVGEIATALEVAPAAVTNLSKRMEALELVERVADAHDGRMTRLRLTATGNAAGLRARVALASLNAQLGAGFTPEELQVVARWLDQAAAVSARAQD
jgi:DNA-binding MarR family transcriptional regulator